MEIVASKDGKKRGKAPSKGKPSFVRRMAAPFLALLKWLEKGQQGKAPCKT
jgi:hypothetical protein